MKKYICILLAAVMMTVSIVIYAEGENEPSMSLEVVNEASEGETTSEPVETEIPSDKENYIYEQNNMDGSENTDEIDMYGLNPPIRDNWSSVANMSEGRADFDTVVINGDLYIIGGLNSSGYTDTIERFNSDTNACETVTSIPDGAIGFSVLSVDDDIYIIGGYSNGSCLNDVRIYNTQTNLWRMGKPMLERRDKAASLYTDNKIYVFGGRNAKGIVNSYEYYDMSNETWNKVTSGYDESLIRIGAKGGYINGYVCIYGGLNKELQYMGVNLYLASDMTNMTQITYKGNEYVSIAWGKDKALVFTAKSTDASKYTVEEMSVSEDNNHARTVKIDEYPINAKYTNNVIYNGYLYCLGGYVSNIKTYKNDIYKYSVNFGNLEAGDGIIDSIVTADGNSITLNVETGKNYYLMVNVNNMRDFNGYAFTIEYPENSFYVIDACAMTERIDRNAGKVRDSDIYITENLSNGVSFTCSESIPTGKNISETVNIIYLRAESSGQRTITYRMIK